VTGGGVVEGPGPVALGLGPGVVVGGAPVVEGRAVVDGAPPVLEADPEGDGVGVRLHEAAAVVTPFW